MVYADLHVHTDNSDGTLSVDALPAAAKRAGLGVVGVTDHDRIHPDIEAPVVERSGIVLVHGIELRVETPTQRVDLLGYGIEPTDALRTELDHLQADRLERGRKIVACLEDELDVSLDVPVEPGIGRPHVARAVVRHPETTYETVEGVFEDLIGDGDQCFVARDVPSFERGVDLLREASAIVGLAHPLRYPDPAAALDRCSVLDALERYYPYGSHGDGEPSVDESTLDEVIGERDLLPTGGSDAHGSELGVAGLSVADYEHMAERLGPVS